MKSWLEDTLDKCFLELKEEKKNRHLFGLKSIAKEKVRHNINKFSLFSGEYEYLENGEDGYEWE